MNILLEAGHAGGRTPLAALTTASLPGWLDTQPDHFMIGTAGSITRQEANTFIAEYLAGLEGYTYLEGEAAR